jgi:hypothetical protein
MRSAVAALLAAFAAASLAGGAAADEGMWTFDAFPADTVRRAHGFAPDRAWLDHARLASVRLAQGCSASFVSAQGLVVTNHHCVQECVKSLSATGKDLRRDGFLAASPQEERRCQDLELDQLTGVTDVTARIRGATKGREGTAFRLAQRTEIARVERECQSSDAIRCEVVTLYQGGLYQLYVYRRFQDVRLVFAPELAAAFFGGDPDNFEFPRYDLDVAFLRAWDGGKPARTTEFFRWSAAGARAGELVFVAGHPGGTDRALTAAELRFERDVSLPDRIARAAEARGLLLGFRLGGEEQRRSSTEELLDVENELKALRGQQAALADPALIASRAEAETALRAEAARDPARGPAVEAAFAAIERAQGPRRAIHRELVALEHLDAGDLFSFARTLLRAGEERARPDGERLPEYREASLPELGQQVVAPAPVHPALERVLLARALARLREDLGADHPAVRRVLGKESPEEVADRAIAGTRLGDAEVRARLWREGKAAVDGAGDPMIAVARAIDPEARAVRRIRDDEIEPAVRRAHEVLADARLALRGRGAYPDATFTLRLSVGEVKGWREGTRDIPPFTTFAGAFERDTGKDPFALPPSWLAARPRLDLATPLDLATTNDIVGGNSGSPVLNAKAELVGVVFDGNRHSLGGEYGFDPATNRAVAVDSRAVVEALGKIYGATRLVEELGAKGPAAPKGKKP